MKNVSQYILLAFAALLITLGSCQKDEYDLGELVAPTNVTLSYEIVGADAENPNGDGSGMVHFTATAENAVTFTFDFGDGTDKMISASGKVTKQFSVTGLNTYNVTVDAVGTGGITSTKAAQLDVLSNFEDEEAVTFLTGGDTKTWYWAYDQPGHVGLGPVTEDYGNLDFTWPNWWSIGAYDEEKACMYDVEFVFTKTENGGVTFQQMNGPAFVPGLYAGEINVDPGDVCYMPGEIEQLTEDLLYSVKNVTFSPSTTLAAEAGDYRGTAMTISDNGFMCWWVGASTYDIIEITENTLSVRIEQGNAGAWYHTFTNVKPD